MKRLVSLLIILMMTVVLFCTACSKEEPSGTGLESGQKMPDFTVSLTDGTTATLSELVSENDLTVLNIFASWCKPCELEFPEMEQVYEANSDRMVILSVSAEPKDTLEIIADYKKSHNLSFPMGIAGDALSFITIPGFPTTFFIDGDGDICYIRVGSFGDSGEFEKKVGYFLSQDYDGNPLGNDIAHNYMQYILLAIPVLGLISVIGRWCLLRKAGKPGWHSIIPFLSTYQEYALCWKGWIGLFALICVIIQLSLNAAINNSLIQDGVITQIVSAIIVIGILVIYLTESMKLAKAFGKGKVAGILLMITGPIGRLVLGFSRGKYQNTEV